MNDTFVPAPVRLVQAGTNQSFTLHPSTAADWAGQWPTERTGDVLVSEAPGTAMGSLFGYWVGNKTLESPGVLEAIKEHLDDHDVVGAHVIFALPDDVHSSLKKDLAQLKSDGAAVKPPLFMDLLAQAEAISINGHMMVREWQTAEWIGEPDNEVFHFAYRHNDIDHYVILTEEAITAGVVDSRSQFLGVDHEGTSLSIQFYKLAPLTVNDLAIKS